MLGRADVGLLVALALGCGSGDIPQADAAASANGPQVVTLTTAEAVFPGGFTELTAVHELADGRVLALDVGERTLQRIDLGTGTAELIGRRGSGPGEYSLPIALLPMPGDSIAVLDMARRRLLMLQPDAAPAGVVPLQFPFTPGDDALGHLRSDMHGHLYVSGMEFAMTANGLEQHDSMPIIRWRIGQPVSDTVAWFRRQDVSITGSQDGKDQNISFRHTPFGARDVWTVGRDGRVVVARPENYELNWWTPAGRGSATLPFTSLPLPEAHKEEWRAAQQGRTRTIVGEDGGATVIPGDDAALVDPPWPESLAPFLGGALQFDRDGTLWVHRTTAVGAPPYYDVVDSTGTLVKKVTLPMGSRIIGFGTGGTIYLVHTDADAVQFLQRFRGTP
jgi:hypothetical protein